jgi:hypothetical protein
MIQTFETLVTGDSRTFCLHFTDVNDGGDIVPLDLNQIETITLAIGRGRTGVATIFKSYQRTLVTDGDPVNGQVKLPLTPADTVNAAPGLHRLQVRVITPGGTNAWTVIDYYPFEIVRRIQ